MKMPGRKEKKQSENAEKQPQASPRSLQCFDDYVNLIQDTINGVMDKSIARQDAHTVGILTGYGLQALREARGGRLKMSVFMQDMRKINVEMLSQEEMDRFLQGNEDIQIEVLKQLEDRGGIITAEVEVKPKQEVKARLDTKLISEISGIEPEKIREALSGELTEPIEMKQPNAHEWTRSLGGSIRFCLNCGLERELLQMADIGKACSGVWGLS